MGFAVPVTVGVGARKEVSPGVFVLGAANAQFGYGYYNNDLGWEPHVTFGLNGGVEFDLF